MYWQAERNQITFSDGNPEVKEQKSTNFPTLTIRNSAMSTMKIGYVVKTHFS